MSELKATTAQEIVRNEKDCDYMDGLFGGVKMPPTQVYLKSEADKVIEELKDKLAAAQLVLRLNEPKALYSNLETMGRLRHEIDVVERRERHDKYKRCLAMAMWCETNVYNIRRKPLCDMDDHEGWLHDDEFWQRWHKRWLELAERYKEVK